MDFEYWLRLSAKESRKIKKENEATPGRPMLSQKGRARCLVRKKKVALDAYERRCLQPGNDCRPLSDVQRLWALLKRKPWSGVEGELYSLCRRGTSGVAFEGC